MKVLHALKALLLKLDLFWSTDYFRYKEEAEYRTLTGGACSAIIMILFIAVFSSSILGTFDKSTLVWQYGLTQQTSKEFTITTKTETESKFMFAISVNGLDLTSSQRYFDFTLSQQTSINGVQSEQNFTLAPCSRKDWEGAGSSILQIYDRLNFSTFLCPPVNQSFSISGMSTAKIFKYLKINVLDCSNNTASTSTCLPTSSLTDYLLTHPNFNFHIYFVNGLINPSNPQEITYYLEDRNYVPFNMNFGGEVNLYMSKYSVTTDEEILPYNSIRTSEGGIVNYVGQYIASRKFGNLFASINIKKSSLSMDIVRQYTKLDSTLSYIGGLFGFIIIFFVFMKVYTEYCYEVDMGDQLYYYDKNDPLHSEKFHFFTFIAYVFYNFLNMLGCDIQWKLMKKYGECREEIQKQFGICFLMKRLIFLERSLRVLFEDHQFKGLHMHEKLTLKEAEELRSFYKLRDQLQGICIEEFAETDQIEKHASKKNSDQSGIMNATENILENNEEIQLEESFNFEAEYKRASFPEKSIIKRNKSEVEMSKNNPPQLVNQSEAMIRPLTSIRHHDSNKEEPVPHDTIQNKLKLLRRESQSGNKISRKIYEGFNSDLLKNILLKVEEDQEEKTDKNEIVIHENQDEFEIRISKRIMVRPKEEAPEEEKNEKEEGTPAEKSLKDNKISNEFEYIQ